VRRFTGGKRFPTDDSERDDGSLLVSYKETRKVEGRWWNRGEPSLNFYCPT